nr:alpha/beta fold hydrolase [Modestobacter versicolor]
MQRATGERRGVFVVATGGPGASGIAEADLRVAGLPVEVTEHYDVVFFDQRGIGLSEPFRCDRTLAADTSGTLDTSSTAAERDEFARESAQLARDCFAEAGVDPADAGRYATRQAAEDLEAFRDWIDADQLVLYGESYGTQLQQTYAAAHPDRVAALVLDGVVDLATDDMTFGLEAALAYSGVLGATLSSCDAQPTCARDAPGSALAQYDALAGQLAAAPQPYAFPLSDGRLDPRELTLEELEQAATWSMSDPWSRQQFQQAVNAAATGNLVPLARLASAAAAADPDTGAVANDPFFSDALYYAVQCADYDVVPAGSTGRAQLDVWLETGRAAGIDQARLDDVFYQDLPCLFWPETGAAPITPPTPSDPPYPLLALTADSDPNTPTQQAERVVARTLGDAALVVQQGGPHVLYGRGEPCVDEAVEQLLSTGRLPGRRTVCPGEVAGVYGPNPPATAAGYADARGAVDAVLDATLGNVTYTWWDGARDLTIGCDAGGTATYALGGDDLRLTLAECAWTADVPVDGELTVAEGGFGDARGSLSLPFAELDLDETQDELTGTFRGAPVG